MICHTWSHTRGLEILGAREMVEVMSIPVLCRGAEPDSRHPKRVAKTTVTAPPWELYTSDVVRHFDVICVCVVYVWVHTCAGMLPAGASAIAGGWSVLDVFLYWYSSWFFWDRGGGLLVNSELSFSQCGWPWYSAIYSLHCPPPPSPHASVSEKSCHTQLVGAGERNRGPQTYTVSTSPTEPSLQPCQGSFLLWLDAS